VDNRGDSYMEDIKGLVRVVEELREYDPKMELGQLLLFLKVVAKPGVRVPELREDVKMSGAAVSRNLSALSSRSYLTDKETGSPAKGHDLLTTVPDEYDARAHVAAPTARGFNLARRLSNLLHGDRPHGAPAR
jgi:DNA-binding MarR family transcriptional regulator